MNFSYKEIFLLGWPILSILLISSIASFAIILERFFFLKKYAVNVRQFFEQIESVLSSGKSANDKAAILGEPMATLTRFALQQSNGSREVLEQSMNRSVRLQNAEYEKWIPFLGTIAGVTPFVGLLGTVLGIIRAFKTLSVSGGGGPTVVAGGISEALVSTALGLMVAIPALVAYNAFSTKVRRIQENMEICVDALVDLLTQK